MMFVYVGTFTGETGARGISVYRMDGRSYVLTHVQTVPGLLSPSFLALHPTRPFLYAVERQLVADGAGVGAVAAFAIDEASGMLTLLNRQASGGVSPAHISVHPGGRFVLAAHYGSGQVAVLAVEDDGSIGKVIDVVQHVGRGPNSGRQEGPHAHFVTPDPSGTFVLVCDLGIDRVMVYRLDTETGTLIPNDISYAQVGSGAGPRHLAFHPNGRHLYVINELDSTIVAFHFDATRGACQIFQTVSTLPEGFHDVSHTAQILVHPSGNFLYGSNRGHDSIVRFALDPATGHLSAPLFEPSGGKTPRNFAVDPSGTVLLAANQDSGTVVPFRIAEHSGRLVPAGEPTQTPSPVCLVFATFGDRQQ